MLLLLLSLLLLNVSASTEENTGLALTEAQSVEMTIQYLCTSEESKAAFLKLVAEHQGGDAFFEGLLRLMDEVSLGLKGDIKDKFNDFRLAFSKSRSQFMRQFNKLNSDLRKVFYIIETNYAPELDKKLFSGIDLNQEAVINKLHKTADDLRVVMDPFLQAFVKTMNRAEAVELQQKGVELKAISDKISASKKELLNVRTKQAEAQGKLNHYTFVASRVTPTTNKQTLQQQIAELRKAKQAAINDIPKHKNGEKVHRGSWFVFSWTSHVEVIDNGEAGHKLYMDTLDHEIASLTSLMVTSDTEFQKAVTEANRLVQDSQAAFDAEKIKFDAENLTFNALAKEHESKLQEMEELRKKLVITDLQVLDVMGRFQNALHALHDRLEKVFGRLEAALGIIGGAYKMIAPALIAPDAFELLKIDFNITKRDPQGWVVQHTRNVVAKASRQLPGLPAALKSAGSFSLPQITKTDL